MRTAIVECKHCGVEYITQLSGHNVLETPKEYQSSEYCPECQKAIVDALSLISVKFKNKFVPTNEVTLDQLLEWEQANYKEEKEKRIKNECLFPLMKKVFSEVYDTELNDYRLTADDNSTRVIYNVRSFRILRKIKNSNSDSTLKKQNKKCLW